MCSTTSVTPGAAHAASLASLIDCHDVVWPVRVTLPPEGSMRIEFASVVACRCSTFQGDRAVAYFRGHALGDEEVPLERVQNGGGDLRIAARVLAKDLDREILRHGANAAHPLGCLLGSPPVGIGIDSSEPRNGFPYRHSPQSGLWPTAREPSVERSRRCSLA